MAIEKKGIQKPAKIRNLATGEIRGVTYLVMIAVGILIAVIRLIAGGLGLPNEYMDNDWIWYGSWCILSMPIALIITGLIEKSEQRRNTRYIKDQSEEKRTFARQLGLDYQTSAESDNIYSSGLLSGIYEGRKITIDSGMSDLTKPYVVIWFTQIEAELSRAKEVSLAFWMNDYQLKKYLQGEETGDIEFVHTDDHIELVEEILHGSNGFKKRFVELGAYHIVVNEGTLLIKFKKGRPTISQMRSYLELTRDVAEQIERSSGDEQAAI